MTRTRGVNEEIVRDKEDTEEGYEEKDTVIADPVWVG